MGTSNGQANVRVTEGGSRLYQGVAKNEFGYQMLAKMGWEEGKGLGKDGSGITTHIKVKKKFNEAGVGAATQYHTTDVLNKDWTANSVTFDNLLSKLKSYSNNDLKAAGGDSDSDSEDGKAAAPKSKKKKESKDKSRKDKKKKKKKKVEKVESSDSEEPESEEDAPSKKKLVVSHQGRYKKVQSQKMVHTYSAAHLAEIFGGNAPPVLKEVRAEASKPEESSSSSGEEEEKEDYKPKKKGKKEEEGGKSKGQETAKKLDTGKMVEMCAPPAPMDLPPLPDDWWGHGMFVRAGGLQDAEEEKRARKAELEREGVDIDARRSFNEADQEALYMKALDGHGKAAGKRGLGKAGMLKIEGGNWGGKKFKYEEGEGEGEGDTIGARVHCEHRHAALKVKWKGVIRKVLEAGGAAGMTVKKLQKKALSAAGAGEEGKGRTVFKQVMMEKLEGSSQFTMSGDTVALAGGEKKRKSSKGEGDGKKKKARKG